MISALHWVPKGACAQHPSHYVVTEDDVEKLKDAAGVDEEEGDTMEALESEHRRSLKREKTHKKLDDVDIADIASEFNLDDYDDEDDEVCLASNAAGLRKLMYYDGNDKDPYITLKEDDDSDKSDAADMEILPTDCVLLAARTDEDEGVSNLDVYIYEEGESNLYVHHDILLPAFPLALAWTDVSLNADTPKGSYVIVGSFQPGIEIWNLDMLDAVEPSAVLGGPVRPDTASSSDAVMEDDDEALKRKKKKKKKKKGAPELKEGSHTDAVISLDCNMRHRTVLASGSADTTVKLWDLTKQQCLYTMTHHTDKVQTVSWNPAEATVLLTGSFDGSVAVLDGRTPSAIATCQLSSVVECVAWNPLSPQYFLVSTEEGGITCHDARSFGDKKTPRPLFTLQAHDESANAMAFNPSIPDLVVTASTDKTLKTWDIHDFQPQCIYSKTMQEVGAVFCLSFFANAPHLLAVGGSRGKLEVWDVREASSVRSRYWDAHGHILQTPRRSSGVPSADHNSATMADANGVEPMATESLSKDQVPLKKKKKAKQRQTR
mmetsp:Transcript_33582/g.54409  ORF Transcript_33582/g.54409 Transcript_33582/m.54409 type:complete len:547 (-) Transcript_33582:262-1902(-)